jgi:creatinine amidohydrolase
MSRARIWEKMTVKEVREALKETQTVLVPVGVTEQHGYHLTLDTDSQSAFQISKRAADETGSFVAPTLTYTFSGGELPGTINIDYHLVSLLISDIIRALCANGVKNIIFVPGHGGSENSRAMREGSEMFYRQHPEYADRNVAIFNFAEVSEACKKAYIDGDFHAGYFETSMMMYWAPDDVRPGVAPLDTPELVARMRQDPDNYQVFSANVDDPAIIKRVAQDPAIQVGVMGDPAQASVELGESICNEAVGALVELVRKVEAG